MTCHHPPLPQRCAPPEMDNESLFAAANVEAHATDEQIQHAEECAVELLLRAMNGTRDHDKTARKRLLQLPPILQQRYNLPDSLFEGSDDTSPLG